MVTPRQQRLMLAAVWCLVAASPALTPAFGDSIGRQDFRVAAEITGEPCRFTDPSDPQQILGPNPAHADCLTALYPPAVPNRYAVDVSGLDASPRPEEDPFSISWASTLWLYVLGVGMLVLAGFNSRKRPRHLPTGTGATFSRSPEPLHPHREPARWKEE